MKHKITAVLFIVLALFSSCSQESDISDVPCQILNLDDHGMITVYPYVKDHNIIDEKYTGFIYGLNEMSASDVILMRNIIAREIEKDYVSAGVEANGNLSVLVLEKKSYKAIDLVALFHRIKSNPK
jgi:hypothetical protein